MFSTDASRTAAPTQNRTSAAYDASELEITWKQAGHEHDSSTAIYTCVSSDFRTRTLRRHLDATVAAALESGSGRQA